MSEVQLAWLTNWPQQCTRTKTSNKGCLAGEQSIRQVTLRSRTTRWKTTPRAIYRVVNNYGTVKQSCKKAKLVPGGFSVCGLCWQKICCCSGPGPRLRPSVSGSGLRPFWRPADLWPSSGWSELVCAGGLTRRDSKKILLLEFLRNGNGFYTIYRIWKKE